MMFTAITLAEWLKQVGLNFGICALCVAGITSIIYLCSFCALLWGKLYAKLTHKPSTVEEISAKINSHLDNIDAALDRIAQKMNIEDKQ